MENIVVALNFSDAEQWLSVPFPLDGGWTDLLAQQTFDVTGNRRDLPVHSNWGRILRRD